MNSIMQGIKFYDCRVIEGSSTSVVLDNGKIEEISRNFTKGAGIRALAGAPGAIRLLKATLTSNAGSKLPQNLLFL